MCRNKEVGTGRRLVGWTTTETEVEYETLSYPICSFAWVKLYFVFMVLVIMVHTILSLGLRWSILVARGDEVVKRAGKV